MLMDADLLQSWDPLKCPSLVDSRTAILNYEFATPGRCHLHRCEYCQKMGEDCSFCRGYQSADLDSLRWLIGPVGADPSHGELLRVVPLMRCHRGGEWVLASGDMLSDGRSLARAQAQNCQVRARGLAFEFEASWRGRMY